MLRDIREQFNRSFDEAQYIRMTDDIHLSNRESLMFRISETPLFLSREMNDMLVTAAHDVVASIQAPGFAEKSNEAIPEGLSVANEDAHPNFLQVDFAICEDANGNLTPQLIELQGFPSLYTYQHYLNTKLRQYFEFPENLTPFYSGLDSTSYRQQLGKLLLGDCDPENVFLLEYQPHQQKTRIDFYLTEEYYGIRPVCLTEIVQRGNYLYYPNGKQLVPIERLYHRFIFDEVVKKNVEVGFDWRDDQIDVHWVGHPNWFFKVSKHSMPLIKSDYSPDCHYLDELDAYPADLENYVLKPLFSFAGSGVEIDVTRDMLDGISDRSNHILQRKVQYTPLVETPDGKAMAEVRMMFLWDDEPILVNNLLRMSKGKMMGVDYNRNRSWVGSSLAYHEV